MNKADAALDSASDRLRDLSGRLDERGGVPGKLAEPLAEDADFLPKLKPSLVKERLKDDPTGSSPAAEAPSTGKRRHSSRAEKKRSGGGKQGGARKTLSLVGAAFGAGVVLAKIIDWRGHAHPRG